MQVDVTKDLLGNMLPEGKVTTVWRASVKMWDEEVDFDHPWMTDH